MKSENRIRSRSDLTLLVVALAFASHAAVFSTPVAGATYQQITSAIDHGIAYLRTKQKAGSWEDIPQRIVTFGGDPNSGQWTGTTAIGAWAMLSGGVDPTDPSIVAAVKFLKDNPTDGMYALGLREQVWSMLPNTPEIKQSLNHDADLILHGLKTHRDESIGLFSYIADNLPNDQEYDHSVSQFAVLGLLAASQSGFKLPRQFWLMTELAWMSHQFPNGGFGYKFNSDYPDTIEESMTAAGVATLFIAQDELAGDTEHGAGNFRTLLSYGGTEVTTVNAQRLKNLWQAHTANSSDPVAVSLDQGLRWVADNYNLVTNKDYPYYSEFGVSRIGAASGRKFLGDNDWYQKGADWICSQQNDNGSFGSIPNTSFALLFLERGLAPVMVNKLEYTRVNDAGKPEPEPTHWNSRPRDANNLARWFGHSTEKFYNWQLVSLEKGPEVLHDSPILYLAGDQSLSFSKEDEEKLRDFIEQGGLILGNADEGKDAFGASFRKLGKRLFHQYEFRELPATSPIYTSEEFQRSHWRTKPQVLALGNGIRELMLLIPRADPSKSWQEGSVTEHPELHQLAANIFLYMTAKDSLRFKLQPFIALADSKLPAGKPFQVARLSYTGNWNPEPGGWRRLAALAHNLDRVEVSVDPVSITDASAAGDGPKGDNSSSKGRGDSVPQQVLANQPLAHLTGTGAFSLLPAQRDAIQKYVANGGTLFIDAAGGNDAFKLSADSELTAIFGKAADQLRDPIDVKALPPSPLRSELLTNTHATFRAGTEARIGRGAALHLRGIVISNRLAVIYSPEDITEGLVGEPVDGVVGYSPQTATEVARSVVRGLSARP